MRIISLNYTPCISHLNKNVSPPFILLVVWTALPILPNLPFGGNPVEGGRTPHISNKTAHFSHQKILLTKQQFLCNHSIQASFIAVVIPVVSSFLNSGFMYMLIFICPRLLNLSAAWQKHWMVKIPPSKIPNTPFHFSMLFGKPCFNYCLFPSLLPLFWFQTL